MCADSVLLLTSAQIPVHNIISAIDYLYFVDFIFTVSMFCMNWKTYWYSLCQYAAVGSLIGSLVLFMFKTPQTKGRNAALFVFIMSAAGLPFCAGFFAYCPSIQVAGVNVRWVVHLYWLPLPIALVKKLIISLQDKLCSSSNVCMDVCILQVRQKH